MKKPLFFSFLFLPLALFSACGSGTQPSASPSDQTASKAKAEVHTITSEQGKEMMQNKDNWILLDVRTEEEFKEQRIEGALLIPSTEISSRAETELPDKEQLIIVYCRSGNRSRSAAKELLKMGYTNIYDMGGIQSWPYETVSG